MVQIFFNDKGIRYDQQAFYQYDYGRSIEIHGLELPSNVQVHFARKGTQATIVFGTTIDNITTVKVPDDILQNDGEIIVYIYLTTETSGQTYKTLTFNVIPREKPQAYDIQNEAKTIQLLMDKLDRIIETGIADYNPSTEVVNSMIETYMTNLDNKETITDNENATYEERLERVENTLEILILGELEAL